MRCLSPWPVFPSHLDPPIARSLSIQFILQAVLDGFELIGSLQSSTPSRFRDGTWQDAIHATSEDLKKIYLFSLEDLSQKGSLLDKLCFYSAILMHASPIHDPEVTMVVEEMRKSILMIKSKIVVWKKMPNRYSVEETLEWLMGFYSDLHRRLGHFFLGLSPYLKEARSDENVLVYLIENKDRFNRYLGTKRIEELLQSFFPEGYDQLRAAIYEGYTRRGFTAFLLSIEPLIEAIQWEIPCDSLLKP